MRVAYWLSMAVFGVVALASIAYVGMTAVAAVEVFRGGPASPSATLAFLSFGWVIAQGILPAGVCYALWKVTRAARRRVA